MGLTRRLAKSLADNARSKDEPLVLIVNVKTEKDVEEVKPEIEQLRDSGECIDMIKKVGF